LPSPSGTNEAHQNGPQAAVVRPRIEHDRAAAGQIQGVLAANSPLAESASIDETYLAVSGLDGLVGPSEAIGRWIEVDSHPQRCSSLPLPSCRLET
jgi:nucleotidyltransferase/DNA polymerase involved in DNA repair